MKLWDRYRKLSVPCWCGAASGERCRNREGAPSALHNTRGKLSREAVDAISKSAGLKPLDTEDPS
jgi:hypothetical protein